MNQGRLINKVGCCYLSTHFLIFSNAHCCCSEFATSLGAFLQKVSTKISLKSAIGTAPKGDLDGALKSSRGSNGGQRHATSDQAPRGAAAHESSRGGGGRLIQNAIRSTAGQGIAARIGEKRDATHDVAPPAAPVEGGGKRRRVVLGQPAGTSGQGGQAQVQVQEETGNSLRFHLFCFFFYCVSTSLSPLSHSLSISKSSGGANASHGSDVRFQLCGGNDACSAAEHGPDDDGSNGAVGAWGRKGGFPGNAAHVQRSFWLSTGPPLTSFSWSRISQRRRGGSISRRRKVRK